MKHALLFLTLLATSAFADTGFVTTNPPTYTPGANGPLSLAPNGGLRIEGNAAATPVPISGTIFTTPAVQPTATQAITNTQCASLTTLTGQATTGFQPSGTWTGTISAYKSGDGTNYVQDTNILTTSGTVVANATVNGYYTFDTSGSIIAAKVCGNTVGSGSALTTISTGIAAQTSAVGLAKLAGSAGAPSAVAITVQPPTESTAAATTTVLAGADATISTACTTCAEVWISNNGSATAYITHGATAASGVGIPLIVGATMVEDRYRGAIHAYGTGSITATKVTP